jgi:hypothetical protein
MTSPTRHITAVSVERPSGIPPWYMLLGGIVRLVDNVPVLP